MSELPARKLPGFGGKMGRGLEELGIRYASDALKFTESQLSVKFDAKACAMLYKQCRGIDDSPVLVCQ